jgi:hypothetical protein
VDPKAEPVTLTLKPHDLDKRAPARVLRGRVLDEDGQPVPEAVVEPFGIGKGDGAQFGGLTGVDELALTNERGEFRVGVPEEGQSLYVLVTARFKAPRRFLRLPAGAKSRDLTLFSGVTVTGRVVKDGRPLAGVAIGVAQKDRNVETFLGPFQAATDAKGVFSIPNVPPKDTLVLYGLMSSLCEHGAVEVRETQTGESGSERSLGDLVVKPGHSLSGKVTLADGKPVPAGTRVLLSREEAWDTQHADVDPDGRFRFTGLPPEGYRLSVSVRGYHVSPKNASTDLLNGSGLLGTIREDIPGLRLLLEPGSQPERPSAFDQKLYEEYDRRRNAPLRGAPEKE